MMPKARSTRKPLARIATRKERFRAALALAGGLKQWEWAEREGITPQWLSLVLNGREVSQTLDLKIDAFVREYLDTGTALAS